MKKILLIPRIKIHNANALSSPYTIGFPAMTAWLGAVHALERKLKAAGFSDLQFKSTGVVCHKIDLQTYKGSGDYVHSIIGTGNPLDKSGKRPSFIEEARCHLDVSIIIEYAYTGLDEDELVEAVDHLMNGFMKIAGGDIIALSSPELHNDRDLGRQRKLIRKLMPGYCLIERRDLMLQAMEEGLDGIDAMLEYIKVTHHCQIDEKGKVKWTSNRKAKGWIIPIATGFQGITEPGLQKIKGTLIHPTALQKVL